MSWITYYLGSEAVDLGRDPAKQKQYIELLKEIDVCNACHLREKLCLPGTGTLDTDIVFVGEAPSKRRTYYLTFGERSRAVFEAILREMGFARREVWSTNVVKCIEPNRRVGSPENCSRFLWRELAIIRPVFVIALGRVASLALLGRVAKPGEVVKKEFTIFCMPHPMTAVYDPSRFRDILFLAMKARDIYEKARGERAWLTF